MPSPEQTELLATPCVTCREHHLKCDRSVPRCGRCVRAGRECKLGFKFKPTKDSFSRGQRWLRPPRKLVYIDETQSLTTGSPLEDTSQYEIHVDETYNGELESNSSSVTPPAIAGLRERNPGNESVGITQPRNQPKVHGLFPSNGVSTSLLNSHRAFPEAKPTESYDVSSLPTGNNIRMSAPRNAPLSSFHAVSSLPLKNRTEALLFRHYIQKLAICLDLCDPSRHFELVVPERAAVSHTLLNAIFAIAARHLSHTTNFDPLASNRYHDECLKHLIPMLDHASTVSDENLFAATIILRMLEEMDVPTTGQDNYSHLLGIHAFVNAGDQYMGRGSLSAASFWVGLRQEIYIAVITQQPVKVSLDHYIVDRSFEAADDYTWSNRAIILIADVLNFCFGDGNFTSGRWNALDEACKKWSATRPSSFNPFFYRERTGSSAFPEVWHGSSCHVIGIQHHILAQLFLTQFDPSIPKVGTNRRTAMKKMTERIENLVRELCGIGICNQWTPPSMFTACMGIAMFGDQFGERSDQDALIDMLQRTEAEHARPTAAIQQQLKKAWGWVPENE
ncbi:uncharacterized protein F4822DRAFT_427660 [Hypoxylon trugodes]|uniref:uncharacterized protein n=1 Tax=Hypoxylon trugodes TaxID=326681 RepID=UPI00219CE973|nr:uncharacterized protein F4822DRAFT_427660 [Hypoxylon trugodes]KAI1389308.1 hypothetical protein F4822DRAFT_427660 [Hypoxylon trugodes]